MVGRSPDDVVTSTAPFTEYGLLFTDASTRDAKRIGGMILRPKGRKKTRLVLVEKFSRDASQTESIDHMEYEALIAGVTLARDLGIERLWAFTDRRGIAEQYSRCPPKPAESSRANLETVFELRKSFKGFGLSWIPRALNTDADRIARNDAPRQRRPVTQREREILESTVRALSEQIAEIDRTIDEADDVGLAGSNRVVVDLKMLRLELLEVKSSAEDRLEGLVLDCAACGQRMHYISGLGGAVGHWAHREPAPHGDPVG